VNAERADQVLGHQKRDLNIPVELSSRRAPVLPPPPVCGGGRGHVVPGVGGASAG